jgi:hypothetical protein
MYEGEFIEWLRLYCSTTFQQRNGLWDMFWCVTKDVNPWDNTPLHFFTTDELYNHWKYIKNNEDK